MFEDFTIFLWLLKLGVLVNLYLLANTLVPPGNPADPCLLVPAQILFAVSGFRCLFPNQYKGNVVFHDTPLSSIFLTRLLARFAEGQIDGTMGGQWGYLPIAPTTRLPGASTSPAAFPDASLDQVVRRPAPVRVAERGPQKRYLAALGSAPAPSGAPAFTVCSDCP